MMDRKPDTHKSNHILHSSSVLRNPISIAIIISLLGESFIIDIHMLDILTWILLDVLIPFNLVLQNLQNLLLIIWLFILKQII